MAALAAPLGWLPNTAQLGAALDQAAGVQDAELVRIVSGWRPFSEAPLQHTCGNRCYHGRRRSQNVVKVQPENAQFRENPFTHARHFFNCPIRLIPPSMTNGSGSQIARHATNRCRKSPPEEAKNQSTTRARDIHEGSSPI
ncbi:hypothetical protein HPP92_024883 [Vanilla planifolia]|uniref:Uncharacterized protein n=1 Tax=Vanilla planifolia TaxID=51239 RepID=A0A835U8H6_VANPL|nr:hypothetical protein HPP92_024883 [Vanilla planifolia]